MAAAAVDLTQVLQGAQSQDRNVGAQAEQQLKQFETQNVSSYLLSLATELANSSKPLETRQIAGVLLKNALSPPRSDDRTQLKAKWTEVDATVKQQLKQMLLSTLPAQAPTARQSAALSVAKVAALELPLQAWPELLPALLGNMSSTDSGLKQATLATLGYVCEDIVSLEEDIFSQEQVNSILTAVVAGLRKDEPDAGVQLAAVLALHNALEFAETNFENDNERNYLMQVVCEGTLAPDARVREASFECLAGIASLHYHRLQPYIKDIFTLTQRAITSDEENVAKQAIEFWCTICDEELELGSEEEEEDSAARAQGFAKQALEPLVPALLAQLTKQDEDQDKDQGVWNLSMAAGTCLSLFAACVGDPIISLVLPYVQSNISRNTAPEDWRCREAATYAFGSMLEGPSITALCQLAGHGLDYLLNAMRSDPSAAVRHTTVWTLGRIFEFVHGPEAMPPVVTAQNLQKIKETLINSLRDEPHIAEKVCFALGQLAVGFKDNGSSSTPLSPFFQEITTALLAVAEKAGQEGEQQLQLHAFEAINDLVRSAAGDTLPVVAQLLPLALQKLTASFQPTAERAGDIQMVCTVQALGWLADDAILHAAAGAKALLCGVLQVVVQKLTETEASKAEVLRQADRGMELLLVMLRAQQATVHEEALLAVGAFTYACGASFSKYLQALMPFVLLGLQNYQEQQVCAATVGVLGDVCRAVESQVGPYCNEILQQLLANLKSPAVARSLKPQILSCFGDIALALGPGFDPYLGHVLQMLQSAQQLSVQQQQQARDDAAYDYNNLLRAGIFEAYSGIFHAMSTTSNQYLQEAAKSVVSFEEVAYAEKDNIMDDNATRAAVSLLGDLATQVQGAGPLFQASWVSAFVNECCNNETDPAVVASGQWAAQQIAKVA